MPACWLYFQKKNGLNNISSASNYFDKKNKDRQHIACFYLDSNHNDDQKIGTLGFFNLETHF